MLARFTNFRSILCSFKVYLKSSSLCLALLLFAKWRIDLIGPFPTGTRGVRYVVVAIDYYTKWAEVEGVVKGTKQRMWNFMWKNIICCFGLPQSIVTNNGKQFDGSEFRANSAHWGIKKHTQLYTMPSQMDRSRSLIKSSYMPSRLISMILKGMGRGVTWHTVIVPNNV